MLSFLRVNREGVMVSQGENDLLVRKVLLYHVDVYFCGVQVIVFGLEPYVVRRGVPSQHDVFKILEKFCVICNGVLSKKGDTSSECASAMC